MKASPIQLLVVLLIVVIIFGPSQLPKLGKIFGKTMKSFKDGMASNTADDEEEVEEVVVKKKTSSGKKVVKKVIEVEVDEDGNEI